jgi:hypothetical protein
VRSGILKATDSVPPMPQPRRRRGHKPKRREWSAYWHWHDKSVGEKGAAAEILQHACVDVVGLISREPGQDPPDCEATLDGRCSGVEVSELVHKPTLERSIRATRDRQAGRDPRQPEAYSVWDRNSLLSALQTLIDRKDRPWKGGPYERHVLVACTNEFSLDRTNVSHFLQGAEFRTKFITDVCLGLSYHDGCNPVFHFAQAQPHKTADGVWTLELQPFLFVARPHDEAMSLPPPESVMQLILKRASASRSSGEWSDDDYDVLAECDVVGRIMRAAAAPEGTPWLWTLDRTPTNGYEATREAAMAAFAKSWRRE